MRDVSLYLFCRRHGCRSAEKSRGDSIPLPPLPPFPSLPLEVGPLNPARGPGKRCKLSQQGHGGRVGWLNAAAANDDRPNIDDYAYGDAWLNWKVKPERPRNTIYWQWAVVYQHSVGMALPNLETSAKAAYVAIGRAVHLACCWNVRVCAGQHRLHYPRNWTSDEP